MLDEIDVKILKDLLKDSRKSFSDIAKECGVSVPTIRARYKRMKAEGIILGSTLLVNPQDLGYETVASIHLNVKPEEVKKFIDSLDYLELFSLNYDHAKEFNVHVEAFLKRNQDLQKITQKFRQNEAVVEMKITLWVDNFDFPENIPIDHLLKKEGK